MAHWLQEVGEMVAELVSLPDITSWALWSQLRAHRGENWGGEEIFGYGVISASMRLATSSGFSIGRKWV